MRHCVHLCVLAVLTPPCTVTFYCLFRLHVAQARSQGGGQRGPCPPAKSSCPPPPILTLSTNLGLVKCSRMCIYNLETHYMHMRLYLLTRLDTRFQNIKQLSASPNPLFKKLSVPWPRTHLPAAPRHSTMRVAIVVPPHLLWRLPLPSPDEHSAGLLYTR